MATYKKRGYKPNTKVEKEAEEINSTTAEVFNTLDETASKTEDFVAKNQKYIFIIIGVVAVVVLSFLGYQEFVAKPAATKAMNNMYQAQKYFNEAVEGTMSQDSLYNLALKGGEGQQGMLDIIKNHGGTPAANQANLYAGLSYLNLKNYKDAIKYLDAFKGDDETFAPMAKGAIGDAFAQLEQNDRALEYYLKAANLKNNEFSTPTYLYKAGIIALEMDKANQALSLFKRIKDDYPTSTEATNADVFIGKAQAMSK